MPRTWPRLLQVIVTCEKIWWLVQQGEQYLKPETRPAGTMVRFSQLSDGMCCSSPVDCCVLLVHWRPAPRAHLSLRGCVYTSHNSGMSLKQ